MRLEGNIVSGSECGYGWVEWSGDRIEAVQIQGLCRSDADWVLPGFIDVHLHGIFRGDATPEMVNFMAEQAPQSGLTVMCPAMASDSPENMLAFIQKVRDLMRDPAPGSVKLAGSHLEGPYLDFAHRGGMNEIFLRDVNFDEIRSWLDEADNTLKIVTIAPEIPNGLAAVKLLADAGVRVSAGHTAMKVSDVEKFIAAGGSGICHLFDTFDGRPVENGVSQVALADEVLVNDELFIELITDGFHVPPALLKLAVRAAGVDRIIGITDSLCGTGLPDGAFPMTDAGREFVLKNGDVCRLKDDPAVIVGSCLTQSQAFYNLTERFRIVNEVDACKILSTNPARYLALENQNGRLQPGFCADITVLKSDKRSVRATVINGVGVYSNGD